MIADDYRDPIKAVIVITPQDCFSGKCDCADASECKFTRCDNCDSIVDREGKTLDTGRSPIPEYYQCPDCGGDTR
jgi:hypothetical protein